MIERIGRERRLTSKARESLVSIDRLLMFFGQPARPTTQDRKEQRTRLSHDRAATSHSLTDHATFLFDKINFLLDATLGFINIEQNKIIKIFSVAAWCSCRRR